MANQDNSNSALGEFVPLSEDASVAIGYNDSKKSVKLTEDQYITLCNNLNAEIENAYVAIKGLSDSLNALIKGDEEGPYWNGSTARGFYLIAKRNLDHDIVAYNEIVKAWEKLRERYVELAKKGYFK